MALTVERIHAAADELDAQGIRPTLSAVRRKLGSGSYTTISEAMQTWRADRVEERDVEPLPESVAERVTAAGREVWAAAVAAAEARTTAEREALAADRTDLETTRDEAVALADAITAELDECRTAAQLAAEQAANDLHTVRTELERAQAETAAARKQAQEAAVAAAELKGQLRTLTAERVDLVATRDEAVARIATITANLDECRTAAQLAAEQAANDLHTVRTALEQAQAETAAARKQAQEAAVAAAELKGQLRTLTDQRDQFAADLAAAQQQIGQLQPKPQGRPGGDPD